eukprot:TRINITY_DN4713_c0_g1_i1.p1 TRINITY_DN4713_c0_g1~~TRINITY_DN4713_c0_g1_i1.p1  ORF type:complete len:143 (+),score=24.89 TRINITY_DN4713_c0_g1_i1:40-468(+)
MDPKIKEAKLKTIWTEVTNAGDDDADWCQYFSETMLENENSLTNNTSVYELLKDDLENLSCVSDITQECVKKSLCDAVWDLVKKPEMPTTQVSSGRPDVIPVSMGKLNSVFKKEIDRRKRGLPELSAEILGCAPHDFFHDHR